MFLQSRILPSGDDLAGQEASRQFQSSSVSLRMVASFVRAFFHAQQSGGLFRRLEHGASYRAGCELQESSHENMTWVDYVLQVLLMLGNGSGFRVVDVTNRLEVARPTTSPRHAPGSRQALICRSGSRTPQLRDHVARPRYRARRVRLAGCNDLRRSAPHDMSWDLRCAAHHDLHFGPASYRATQLSISHRW